MDEITINRQFKEKYGIDLCDYILNRRFNCAKELLRFSVKPVKEIVTESGIMNADLFRHLFIENEGMTAAEKAVSSFLPFLWECGRISVIRACSPIWRKWSTPPLTLA